MHHCYVLVCGTVSKTHLAQMVHLSAERGGRRATLADSASELSSNILGRLALKIRGGARATLADSASELSSNILAPLAFKVQMHYNQARRDHA